MLSQEFIQEIIDNNDIEDVISYYVQLRRVGAGRAKGLCPFHNEKTPSFCVSLDKQLYYCFGCGNGGNVITFITKKENLSFTEAARFLADRAGLQFPSIHDSRSKLREDIYEVNKYAARFFYRQLSGKKGSQAREYLTRRGLAPDTIKKFAIGYAPKSYSLEEGGYDAELLRSAGLLIKNKTGEYYPRFQNRIIFPIVDIYGRVIAFGGRTLGDDIPKYLNSPETVVFDKSRNLYGLRHASKTSEDCFILVEGYMDVVSLAQSGVDNAVASLGTAFTRFHASELKKRKKSDIVIAYDSDEAGRKATERAIEILSSAGLKCRILSCRGCKDPDEYVRKFGAGAFKTLVMESKNSVEYVLCGMKKFFSDDYDGKIAFMKQAAAYLSKIQSPLECEINAKKLAHDEGVSLSSLLNEIELNLKKQRSGGSYTQNKLHNSISLLNNDDEKCMKVQKMLLSIMCDFPEVRDEISSKIDESYFDEGECRTMAAMLLSGTDISEIKNNQQVSRFMAELALSDDFSGDVSLAVRELCEQIVKYNKDKLIKQAMARNDLSELNRLLLDR